MHPDRLEFSQAYVTDSEGLIRVSSGPAIIGERLGPVNLYQQAYSSQTLGASDAIVPSGDQDSFILFVRPLRWNANHPEGFLVLQTRLLTIAEVINLSTYLAPGAKAAILDSRGRLLARYEHQASQLGITPGEDISDSDFWKNALGRPVKEHYGTGLSGPNKSGSPALLVKRMLKGSLIDEMEASPKRAPGGISSPFW